MSPGGTPASVRMYCSPLHEHHVAHAKRERELAISNVTESTPVYRSQEPIFNSKSSPQLRRYSRRRPPATHDRMIGRASLRYGRVVVPRLVHGVSAAEAQPALQMKACSVHSKLDCAGLAACGRLSGIDSVKLGTCGRFGKRCVSDFWSPLMPLPSTFAPFRSASMFVVGDTVAVCPMVVREERF